MKKFIITIFLFLFFLPVTSFCQSIAAYSINPAGGFVNSNSNIEFSLCQNIQQFSNNQASINNSLFFIFGNKNKSPKSPIIDNSNILVTVYPNPVVDFANIVVTTDFEIEKINLKITDDNGKVINNSLFANTTNNYLKQQIDLTSAQSGIYIATIIINSKFYKTFKIIKK